MGGRYSVAVVGSKVAGGGDAGLRGIRAVELER